MTQTQTNNHSQAIRADWMSRARGLTAVLGIGAALMAAAVSFDARAAAHCMHKGPADGGPANGAPAEMWMGPLGSQGKHAERLHKRLNITPEQQAKLQDLAKAQQAERQAQQATHQALHKDMQAFLSQPTWNEAEEKTLRARALAMHQDMAEKRWQHKMDMAKVLTPEQRKQAMTMMEKRMSHHKDKREKNRQGGGMNKAQ
jgi:Spy/CpxP family protein refolding chaperone